MPRLLRRLDETGKRQVVTLHCLRHRGTTGQRRPGIALLKIGQAGLGGGEGVGLVPETGDGDTGHGLCGAPVLSCPFTLPANADKDKMPIGPLKNFAPTAVCPLDGLRVLDLTRLVAGNQVSALLADFGAEVIKIEPPDGDPLRSWGAGGHPVQWKIYARNKKSVRMNLRDNRAKELLLKLVETADVFIENFRVGGLEKIGLAPDMLHARNPGLVILRVTGFGQTGPYRERPGFGTLIEAMTGFAMKTGFPDKPPSLPNMALADMVAGMVVSMVAGGV